MSTKVLKVSMCERKSKPCSASSVDVESDIPCTCTGLKRLRKLMRGLAAFGTRFRDQKVEGKATLMSQPSGGLEQVKLLRGCGGLRLD